MEQNKHPYIKGFNEGYILSKYDLQLTSTIVKNILPSNDFLEGFLNGKDEFEHELQKEKLDDIQILRSHSNIKDIELGRDK